MVDMDINVFFVHNSTRSFDWYQFWPKNLKNKIFVFFGFSRQNLDFGSFHSPVLVLDVWVPYLFFRAILIETNQIKHSMRYKRYFTHSWPFYTPLKKWFYFPVSGFIFPKNEEVVSSDLRIVENFFGVESRVWHHILLLKCLDRNYRLYRTLYSSSKSEKFALKFDQNTQKCEVAPQTEK